MTASYDVVVVGGGAAGLAAASFALQSGASVLLADKNEKLGKKIYITGKGRGNVTNACEMEQFLGHVPRNPRFLYAPLRFFGPEALMQFLARFGCETVTERGNRVFPASQHASDITRAWTRALDGCDVRLHTAAQSLIMREGQAAGVCFTVGAHTQTVGCKAVILACGGMSYPATGSTGDGYRLAQQCGHRLLDPVPSLTGLETVETWPAALQGLALKNVCLMAAIHDTIQYREQGEMLFTHYGISGPLVLTLSSDLARCNWHEVQLYVDLKPGLSPAQTDAALLRHMAQAPRKKLETALCAMLPARLAAIFPSLAGVDGQTQCAQLTQAQRSALVACMKRLPLHPSAPRGMEEAIVTCGGVDVKQVSPSTMMSKLVPGLFFAGEMLDVDAHTGGFNLQIAFSTGALAGSSAAAYALQYT